MMDRVGQNGGSESGGGAGRKGCNLSFEPEKG